MKTEDLLQKYVSIGLSKDERFELEKRALEDDFLSEAWEGLQLHQGSDLRQKWNTIKAEWQHKYIVVQQPSTKVVAMRSWMQYAAAAAMLLLGATLFFMRSDESLSNDAGIVAIDPTELTEEQEVLTASESAESIVALSDLEEREVVEVEKSIHAKADKILPLSKIKQKASSTEVVTEKNQSLAPPKKNRDVVFVAPTQAELAAIETKNSLVQPTPIPIPNPEAVEEGRAIDKKVEDLGSVEILNANEAPILAKIEATDRDHQKSSNLFKQSKRVRDNEGVKLSDLKEGAKPTSPEKENFASASQVKGLKKNFLDNSKVAKNAGPTKPSLQRARDLFLKNKDYEGARDEAVRVINLKSNSSEGYELIGDIYSAASYTCGTDEWNQSLAVLAADDQFTKAISTSTNASSLKQLQNKIAGLQDRLPTKNEGFLRGVKAGNTAKVSCWISESVTIRFK